MNLYEILQNSGRVGDGMTHFERLFAQKMGGGKISEISGVPPLRYIGDGRPLTDYVIAGNTLQDGTPTPENPVPVVGCGTDTANGFKLSPTVNGTEYPIYLGTVPTTRRIKKLVLTGEESWESASGSAFRATITDAHGFSQTVIAPVYCSHYVAKSYVDVYTGREYGISVRSGGTEITRGFAISKGDITGVSDFKSYLAAQYAAGTPVTVWYVLAEPETGIVNEPLMKIGDYADTISFDQAGVTIPTVNGENVLDVPTEVKPSEVWIRGRIKEV